MSAAAGQCAARHNRSCLLRCTLVNLTQKGMGPWCGAASPDNPRVRLQLPGLLTPLLRVSNQKETEEISMSTGRVFV